MGLPGISDRCKSLRPSPVSPALAGASGRFSEPGTECDLAMPNQANRRGHRPDKAMGLGKRVDTQAPPTGLQAGAARR